MEMKLQTYVSSLCIFMSLLPQLIIVPSLQCSTIRHVLLLHVSASFDHHQIYTVTR
jgi:hypothetical protein